MKDLRESLPKSAASKIRMKRGKKNVYYYIRFIIIIIITTNAVAVKLKIKPRVAYS